MVRTSEGIKPARNFDWRTTDQEEIELRQRRAREEQPRFETLNRRGGFSHSLK